MAGKHDREREGSSRIKALAQAKQEARDQHHANLFAANDEILEENEQDKGPDLKTTRGKKSSKRSRNAAEMERNTTAHRGDTTRHVDKNQFSDPRAKARPQRRPDPYMEPLVNPPIIPGEQAHITKARMKHEEEQKQKQKQKLEEEATVAGKKAKLNNGAPRKISGHDRAQSSNAEASVQSEASKEFVLPSLKAAQDIKARNKPTDKYIADPLDITDFSAVEDQYEIVCALSKLCWDDKNFLTGPSMPGPFLKTVNTRMSRLQSLMAMLQDGGEILVSKRTLDPNPNAPGLADLITSSSDVGAASAHLATAYENLLATMRDYHPTTLHPIWDKVNQEIALLATKHEEQTQQKSIARRTDRPQHDKLIAATEAQKALFEFIRDGILHASGTLVPLKRSQNRQSTTAANNAAPLTAPIEDSYAMEDVVFTHVRTVKEELLSGLANRADQLDASAIAAWSLNAKKRILQLQGELSMPDQENDLWTNDEAKRFELQFLNTGIDLFKPQFGEKEKIGSD